jgi:hypothetical protein
MIIVFKRFTLSKLAPLSSESGAIIVPLGGSQGAFLIYIYGCALGERHAIGFVEGADINAVEADAEAANTSTSVHSFLASSLLLSFFVLFSFIFLLLSFLKQGNTRT